MVSCEQQKAGSCEPAFVGGVHHVMEKFSLRQIFSLAIT